MYYKQYTDRIIYNIDSIPAKGQILDTPLYLIDFLHYTDPFNHALLVYQRLFIKRQTMCLQCISNIGLFVTICKRDILIIYKII